VDGRSRGATMIEIRRAAGRAVTHQDGITTWHSFSSGAHYDPGNLAFGSLIACDEHLLEPGAGFERHAHRGVELVSWVLGGVLEHEGWTGLQREDCTGLQREDGTVPQHEDCRPRRHRIAAGTVQHQSAGSGIEHVERNGSAVARLRFLQMSVLGDTAAPRYGLHDMSHALRIGATDFSLLRLAGTHVVAAAPFVHAQVVSGQAEVNDSGRLHPADGVRVTGQALTLRGAAEVLVWSMPGRRSIPGRRRIPGRADG
jgi:quercetin 2,3-dioxygenase